MQAIILFVLSTIHLPLVVFGGQDTGMSQCPALTQHYHNNDSSCHWDSDDRVVYLLPKVNPNAPYS